MRALEYVAVCGVEKKSACPFFVCYFGSSLIWDALTWCILIHTQRKSVNATSKNLLKTISREIIKKNIPNMLNPYIKTVVRNGLLSYMLPSETRIRELDRIFIHLKSVPVARFIPSRQEGSGLHHLDSRAQDRYGRTTYKCFCSNVLLSLYHILFFSSSDFHSPIQIYRHLTWFLICHWLGWLHRLQPLAISMTLLFGLGMTKHWKMQCWRLEFWHL